MEFEFIHPKAIADTNKKVDVEGRYHDLPVNEKVPMDKYAESFEISHGYNFALANVAYRYGFFPTEKIPYGRPQLVGRVGLGSTIIHPESIVDGHRHYVDKGGYEVGGLGLQFSPGVEVTLWKGLDAFAEYKYTYTQLDHVSIRSGNAKVTLESDHVAFGLSYHFK